MARITAAELLKFALVAAVAVQTGICLHCYECDSEQDNSCADNPKEIHECHKSRVQNVLDTVAKNVFGGEKAETACLKYVGINESTKKEVVIRLCEPMVNSCEAVSLVYLSKGFDKEFCDVCYKDKCNSSSIPSVKLFLLVPLILCGIFFS